MFRGSHTAKVDEKGRLKLPAQFKELLDTQQATHVYITSSDGNSAEIWPLQEWEKQETLLAKSSRMNDAVAMYLNWTSYYGQQVEIDSQARVLLPQELRSAAKLDAEVKVMGKLNYLEVVNLATLKDTLKALTKEDRAVVDTVLSSQGDK